MGKKWLSDLLPTDSIIRMERVRYADKIPVVYEVASIPEKFIKNFKKKEVTSTSFKPKSMVIELVISPDHICAFSKRKIAHCREVEKEACYSRFDSGFLL